MQIFEYPYIIITILVLFFILLSLIGIYFAIRGVKTASGKDEKDFTHVSRIESLFNKALEPGGIRCIFYISVYLENFTSLYSKEKSEVAFSDIKKIILDSFCDESGCSVSPHGESNFIAFSNWKEEQAKENLEKFNEDLNKCLLTHGARNVIDVSTGIYFSAGSDLSFDKALDRSKQACIHAKNENLPFCKWSVAIGKDFENKIEIENNIEKELDNNRFYLEYQPIIDAKTMKITGAEVLSRLNSENGGILSPMSFLSAVDSVGLTNKFDYYIFEKNCKWISCDKKLRENYTYTVNFSRATVCEEDFPKKIADIVQKYGLKFSCIAIEILEDKSISENSRLVMMKNLSELKDKGISFYLDDFGSGYATFRDLQCLDLTTVKIDKTITHNAVNETGFIILKNIITTAKDIGFKTLCEGIETKEHQDVVIRAGCDMLQGYYYYKPMAVASLEKLLKENNGGR